ncbi:MAG: hypothetical protein ACTHKX_09995, partial [Pseudolysinimonas sp.]
AELLEIAAGDRVRIGDVDAVVAGTWRVDDALDPRWMGDPLVTSGADGTDTGLVVVDESLWPQLDTDPRARWTLVPDPATVTARDLAPIVAEWNHIGIEWRGQVTSQLITLEKQGRFKRSAIELGTRVDGLQAIQPVVLLLLAAIALVTLAELGRLLTTTRATEIALLWSRGASALDIARSTAAEVAVAAGAGALLGTSGALGVLGAALGPDAIVTCGAAAWVVPVAATASAVLLVAGGALRSARRQTVRDPRDASGRARRLAGHGLVVLTVAAAALAVWQLQLYGSPLTPTADGGTDVDPVAVVAPALTLVAMVLIALTLFPRVAALTEVAARRAGTARILAARTVARRLQLVAAPLAVVAVACSTLVLAAAYSATWSDSFTRTTALRAGAPLQVSTGYTGLTADDIGRLRALPGVDGVAAVDVETLQIGGDTGTILGVTPATLARVATTASGTLDRDRIAAALTTDLPGPALPDGADTLTLTTAQTGFREAPALSLQVMDGDGLLHTIDARAPVTQGIDPTHSTDAVTFAGVTYTMPIPQELADAPTPWQVMTIDVSVTQASVTGDETAQFVLTDLAADGSPLELDRFWLPESPILQFDSPIPDFAGLGFRIDANVLSIRMTPTFDQQISDLSAPPVVISQQMADRYRLKVGDPVSFVLDDAYDRSTGTVALIVPAIPGADLETALMVDLGYVLHHRLRVEQTPDLPTVLWVDTAAPEATAMAFRQELPANTRMQSAGDPAGRTVLGSAATALWLGAGGCLVLAIITVIAVARAQLRSRRLDVVVLRAIGFGSRDQAAVRRRELGLVLGFGVVAGLVAGAAVSLLTVPQLARAAVVEPYASVPTPLVMDLAALGTGLGLLLLGLAGIVMIYASRVARHARTAIGAEEVL